jgi:hypothetical protein
MQLSYQFSQLSVLIRLCAAEAHAACLFFARILQTL